VDQYANHTLNEDSGSAGKDYNMVTLLTYMTTETPRYRLATAFTWYDEMIVSTQPIAAPNN